MEEFQREELVRRLTDFNEQNNELQKTIEKKTKQYDILMEAIKNDPRYMKCQELLESIKAPPYKRGK